MIAASFRRDAPLRLVAVAVLRRLAASARAAKSLRNVFDPSAAQHPGRIGTRHYLGGMRAMKSVM